MSNDTKILKLQNRIQICRIMARYSQKELAYLLGVPQKTVARWERWTRTPSVYHAIGIEVALRRFAGEIFSQHRREWSTVIDRRKEALQKLKVKNTNVNANVNENDNDKK